MTFPAQKFFKNKNLSQCVELCSSLRWLMDKSKLHISHRSINSSVDGDRLFLESPFDWLQVFT